MSKLTGITAFTLRFYEKVGVLPAPGRQNGIRRYNEQDLQFIRFVHGLKETGMGLEDIAAIAEDGCLLSWSDDGADRMNIHVTIEKRLRILEQHIGKLDLNMKQLEAVKAVAQEKMAFYSELLRGE